MPTSPDPEQVRRRTGGRSARVRESALHAALDVAAESGYADVTMNQVARRAGIAATTILRRWGSAEALLLDAMLTYSEDQLAIPDTGTLRGDFDAFARLLTSYLSSPEGGVLARALAANDDEDLAATRAEFWKTRLGTASAIIDRAIDRGELPAGANAQRALELVIAPLHFRHLMTHQMIDDAYLDEVVEVVVRGLTR